jgi:hypothetical protein
MDPQNQQPPIQQPQTPAQMTPVPEHKKVGPIIAILIIILVLIIGALYLFASRINQEQVPVDSAVAASSASNTTQSDTTVQPVTNKSDDVGSLEADLNASAKGLDGQNF